MASQAAAIELKSSVFSRANVLCDEVDSLVYKVEHKADLFGNDEERVVKATNMTIARYFNERLKTVFPANGVAEPGVLRNSSNNPLYLLCFAAGNDKGAPIAVKIANHILKETR
ncbi:MAG TPA: hypothetical protein VMT03_12775 [Polyangia bacterium]|nr:hypothetical protein [Polyangia bacterium]